MNASDNDTIYTTKFSVQPSKSPSGWVIKPLSGNDSESNDTLDCIALAGTEVNTVAKVKFLLAEESQQEWQNLSITSLNIDDPKEVELTLFKSVQNGKGFNMKFLNKKGTGLEPGVVIEDFKFSSQNNEDGEIYLSEDPRLGTVRPPN